MDGEIDTTQGTTIDGPPDLLGAIGAARRRLDDLARETVRNAVSGAEDRGSWVATERDRHERRIAAIAETRDSTVRDARAAAAREIDAARLAWDQRREEIESQAEDMRRRIRRKAARNRSAAETALEEAIWVADSVYEGNEGRPREEFEKTRTEIAAITDELQDLEARMKRETRRYRQPRPRAGEVDPKALAAATGQPLASLRVEIHRARTAAEEFRRLGLPMIFRGPILVIPAAALAGAGLGIAALTRSTDGAVPADALVTGAVIGFAIFAVLAIVLYIVARRQVVRAWQPFDLATQLIHAAATTAEDAARTARAEAERDLVATRDRDIEKARRTYEPLVGAAQEKAEARLAEIERRVPLNLAVAEREHDAAVAEARRLEKAIVEDAIGTHDTEIAAERIRHEQEMARIHGNDADAQSRRAERWRAGVETDVDHLQTISTAINERFPNFTDPWWKEWRPATAPPPGVRLGRLVYDRAAVEGGLPEDEHLVLDAPTVLEIPAAISLPSRASLQIDCDATDRDAGLGLLRATMLRLLATVPPGKARLTIIDPVGLGQNFAGFMHLEDELPGLVGERIWTESRQIEQKLADITDHMETVIQKYLRNEFDSIDAYNEAAGEIAEPYRFLVISDFPANFNDESARRLASILQSGPRCGVFTLVLRDRRLPMPELFDPEDLDRHAVTIRSREGRLRFEAEGLGDLPFLPDPGPPDDLLIEMAHRIGAAAREAGRVEVPFEAIAPTKSEYWTRSTTESVRVALGRAGATRLQELVLGRGTAQHALVAGRTGSGKSTLLHALVTNLACWHSPDEIEFYLVDFKKGVEFKTYATHRLPHARAVAVESDREFGLSVLQGLDQILTDRGERFRAENVQDLAGFRSRCPDEPMPRILLVVDEFQELFVDDDKVSQDAGLLLDRLVRQGRAFGMHVLLGSQTLGGAYSLNRATMGQMGIRIALACNEQDSMLILSDDNVAARLLSRPGEAIYNDQGGLVEGNSPFQVCWLPDAVRENHLANVAELARQRGVADRGCVVFEGNAPAPLSGNRLLRSAIERVPTSRPVSVPLWLGEAVAIKDPTEAVLRRQAGSNLAVVGQADEHALGLVTASIVAAAAGHRLDALSAVVLDGTPADDPNAGVLDAVAKHLPHRIDRPGFRESGDAVLDIGRELARRIEAGEHDAPTILLVVHGLHRFRVLRRAEDDYGFSMDDAPPTPDKVFGSILRDGPEHGVFTIAWADTVGTLERCVDRQTMRSFDQRAMFQVGATDSSTLIDSPAAANLGPNRGLLYRDDRGTIEKFRPWSLPGESWLAGIGLRMAERER
jgi:S-DNA-T family DNA segregation ATPase FtsK/SpoIIIE